MDKGRVKIMTRIPGESSTLELTTGSEVHFHVEKSRKSPTSKELNTKTYP